MLTAKYERLGLREHDKILDLGCGFGRHAFEAARRGASVIALDAGRSEVEGVAGMFCAMVEAGELKVGSTHAHVVQGDALHLPFPDGTFDRVICSEVLEHIPEDRRRDARAGARAATGRHHGDHGASIRARADQLGVVRRVPQRAGRSYPYLSQTSAHATSHLDRTRRDRSPLRARPAQPVLVAQVPRRHDQRGAPARQALPPPARVGHHEEAPHSPATPSGALAAHGQVHRRLPEEASELADEHARRRAGRPERRGARRRRPSHLARLQRPERAHSLVRWGPQRSVEPRRSRHGPHGGGLPRRGARRLSLAGGEPARRRQLVQLLRRHAGERHRDSTPTCAPMSRPVSTTTCS